MPSFGFGHRFSRRRSFQLGSAFGSVLYGPKIGPNGPKQIVVAAFNQADVGYCYETDNVAENLPAKWASRGINAMKVGHPDSVLQGRAAQLLTATKNAGLMLIAAPTWPQYYQPVADPGSLDFRNLAINDPYWRTNWIEYQVLDEMDLLLNPLSDHLAEIGRWALSGVSKPVTANFTRRVAIPSASEGGASILFKQAFDAPQINGLSIDSYEWHLSATDSNGATATSSSPDMWVSTWNGDGIWNTLLPQTRGSFGRRFTASVTGLAVHLQRNGPVIPGRSDSGNMPVQYLPIYFNTPPFTVRGQQILPQPMAYAPGDKFTGHFVATGRVDVNPTAYARGGQWQPGRFLRNEGWSGFVHGSSALYIFPQTVGSFTALGYVAAGTNTVHVTGTPQRFIAGALRVLNPGGAEVGWIRRDSPQLKGTTGGIGSYALDPAKRTPVNTGSAGTPVTLTFATEARPWGDDTNAENLSELTTIIANLNRMQAHPTGGNLMMDTARGGRKAITTLRCPDINGDPSLYREDMTLAPIQAGYTDAGVAIPDSGGGLPLWEFGWPMGFEGFRTTGADGAAYIYVRSMSNSNRPTLFSGYAALGLPARVFGPFEVVGFRRVGVASAVEMTGSSGIIKAGVDDGAATWFYIETAELVQNEGNSGTTAFAFTVRRGGNLSGTNTVTATVSGTGITPANAADFQGGTFPTQVLSFAPTETTKVFTATVNGDTTAEFNETAKVTLSAPSGGAQLVGSRKSEALLTITNDDAPLASSFIWLGGTLTGAPALSGSPPGATYLNASETTNVTRAGITMRSRSSGTTAYNGGHFANTPGWLFSNVFSTPLFQIAAGNWEFAVIAVFSGTGSGTVKIIDDPDGAATERQSLALSAIAASLIDTDNTRYTNASLAVADAVNNLTFVPVTVSNLGGGNGLVRVQSADLMVLSAIALRRVT